MKKLIVFTLILTLFLTSCGSVFLRNADGSENTVTSGTESRTEAKTEAKTEAETEVKTEMPTAEDTAEPEETPAERLIGFYDEVTTAGVYNRLSEYTSPWTAGVDIGCFDILLSGEDALVGDSYKALWQSTADESGISDAKIYLTLEYTLTDGEKVAVDISDYSGADRAVADGYVEIYLYDDVHQADGAWYSHLTADTTDASTVVTSVKVTAGEKIDDVVDIKLTARVEGSMDAVIELIKG